jgi:hypothetical protein
MYYVFACTGYTQNYSWIDLYPLEKENVKQAKGS